jgi:hypothetical protein
LAGVWVAPGISVQPSHAPVARRGQGTRLSSRWSAFLVGGTVYGLWAVMTAALLLLVTTYGDNLPGPDEWHLVPIWLGKEPLTWSYLFSHHAEHVLPLSRALLVAMARVTDGDFRAGMFASVFVLSATALALIWTARQLRGRLSLTDIVFPLLLLHLGHRENVLQGWTVHNALFTALAVAVLILLLLPPQRLSMRRTIAFGGLLLLVAYTGAGGQVVSFVLAVWFLGNCLLTRQRSAGRQRSIATVGAVLACVSLANIRCLRGFDLTPLTPVVPWLVIVLGIAFSVRLVHGRLLRAGICLGVLVLTVGLAWLLSLPEAAYEAMALTACLWAVYRGVARYRQRDEAAKLDGVLIIGLALTAALSAIVFRRIDRDCLWMVAGCLTLSLGIWSLMRIGRLSGRIGALASLLILAAITLGPSYRIAPPSPSVWATLRGAIMFLSTAFGVTSTNHWPYSGLATTLLWLTAAFVLMRAAIQRRRPVGGLIAYSVAFTLLALSLGWGRAGFDDTACLEQRYALLSVPFLCAVYFIIGMAPLPALSKAVQFLLAALVLLWSPDNLREGVVLARHMHEKNRRFLQDMNAGKPLMYVIHHHRWWVPHGWSWSAYLEMKRGMELFHDAKWPAFAQMRLDWPEVNQEIVFEGPHARSQKPGSHSQSGEGQVSIRLDRPRRIYAIMVRFAPIGQRTGWQPAIVRIHWPGGPPQGEDILLSRLPDDLTACAWVDRDIDRIEVDWSPADSVRAERIGCLVPTAFTPLELRAGRPNPFFKF